MKLLPAIFLLATLAVAGCAPKVRPIVAEPLGKHDRGRDLEYCQRYAERYGVINMDPLMSGSGMEDFPDRARQVQLFESCMLKKGYRF